MTPRIVVCGSRALSDPALVARAIDESGFAIGVLLSGAARGVDELAEAWARARGIAIERFPAEWGKYGWSAGLRRNAAMIATAHGLVAVWNGFSRGTSHAIEHAIACKLPVFVWHPPSAGGAYRR